MKIHDRMKGLVDAADRLAQTKLRLQFILNTKDRPDSLWTQREVIEAHRDAEKALDQLAIEARKYAAGDS